ncbi:MAG: hypothetical protein D3924_19435, partial [Candidatus Electrothrix sp. AR4]|nr:hypothetical protein [Candidatus Electrothrix sp. AR4]
MPPAPNNPVHLRQDIRISFDLEQSVMNGESSITLPPGMELRLLFGDLEQVRIMVNEGDAAEYNERKAIAPNDDNTLYLAPDPQERTIFLFWRLTAAPPGNGSGNLISPQGITLAGFWHPITEEDMLFSLTAELPPGFNGVTEADEIDIITAEYAYDNEQVLTASSPHPLRSINFVAGPYVVLSRSISNLTLYTYFFEEDARLAAGY